MFKLFMGCFGNGILVCNAGVMEYGDYKRIAHITTGGNVTWYDKQTNIPESDLRRIKNTASQVKQKFQRDFEEKDNNWQYRCMLEMFDTQHFLYYTSDEFKQGRSLEERLKDMRKYFYTIA